MKVCIRKKFVVLCFVNYLSQKKSLKISVLTALYNIVSYSSS